MSPVVPLPRTALRHRRNVERLTADQLGHVRSAIAAAAALSDDRGYQHWAGIHGLPLPMYCQHGGAGPQGARLFLPWHRAYLYLLEQQLRDLVHASAPAFALPWWDWTSTRSHTDGLPSGYAASRAAGDAEPARVAAGAGLGAPGRPAAQDDARAEPAERAADPGRRRERAGRDATSSPSRRAWRTCTTGSTYGSAARWARSHGPPTTRCSGPTTR